MSLPTRLPFGNLLRNRDFTLLWIGQTTSLLGDQFYLIALPWLVLQITGDPLALGTVLAIAGVPRALFMLVGGAVSDRFSARIAMLSTDVIRLALTALLAVLVITGAVQLWMLYLFSLAFGLVGGIFHPASTSIIPRIVPTGDLEGANAIYQGSSQISIFLGPGIAGAVIAFFSRNGGGPANPSLEGISIAFAVDAFTFLVSTVTLWMLREEPGALQAESRNGTVLTAIREGIRYMWHDPILRVVYVLVGVINFLFMGPLMVGIPVLADRRLPEGAAAFGLIISAYGGGNLIGILMAGSLPKPSGRFMERLLVISLAVFGVGIAYFAFLRSTWVAFLVLLALGVGNGYLVIIFITYLQRRTPKNMLGRVMSLILFANAGLTPISQALAGAVIKFSLESMFLAAGILVVLTDLWLALQPQLRAMSRELVSEISAGLKRGEETPTNP